MPVMLLINVIFSILSFRTPFIYPGEYFDKLSGHLLQSLSLPNCSVAAGFLTINSAGVPLK